MSYERGMTYCPPASWKTSAK